VNTGMTIGITLVWLIVVAVAASVLTYVLLKRRFQRTVQQLRDEATPHISLLEQTVRKLEIEVTELRAAHAISATPPSGTEKTASAMVVKEEVSAEMLAILAAAVTAYLGKKVRIRSAKMIQTPYEFVNPWAQQGRVIVQASHNLRPRS